MKPTSQISHNQSQDAGFPLTDYNFQATADSKSGCATIRSEKKPFWKITTDFFNVEGPLDYVVELLFFTVISAISAWPIMAMLHAITRMVRNY